MDGLNTRKEITISSKETGRLPFSQGRIKSCIQKIFKLLKRAPLRRPIAVVFFNDEKIKDLNQKYLKRNTPTDVLVFDYRAHGAELAISIDTAKRNAQIYHTSLKKEVMLYIIHGILHLCGYDDTTQKAKRKMFKKQEEIFKKIAKRFS